MAYEGLYINTVREVIQRDAGHDDLLSMMTTVMMCICLIAANIIHLFQFVLYISSGQCNVNKITVSIFADKSGG